MAVRSATRRISRRHRGGTAGPLVLAIALAIAAVAFLRQPTPQPAVVTQPVVAEFDAVKVPVPSEFVPAGTRMRDVKFKTMSYPKHQLPAGALMSLEGYVEAVAVAPLPANLPLFASNLSLTAQASNPVLERIPPGMRAMTIRVDATSAVEGWAGSGSVVDVLLVEKERTTVIAEKVKVLSAERSVSPVEGSSAPSVPSTVTLLVTQEQCLAINTAIPLGKIAFALRSIKDEENWNDTIFTPDNLKQGVVPEQRLAVSGYVSVKEQGKEHSFALADGKWVKTEVVPEGFFVSGAGESHEKGRP